MRGKLPIDSHYLDNSEKCKILQEHLINACKYYIAKIDGNSLDLGLCKINWTYFSFYTSGVHSDISKARDMIVKLASHIDAEALKPLLKTIPNDIGNFHVDSMKVILARSLFDIINMDRPAKEKLLFE